MRAKCTNNELISSLKNYGCVNNQTAQHISIPTYARDGYVNIVDVKMNGFFLQNDRCWIVYIYLFTCLFDTSPPRLSKILWFRSIRFRKEYSWYKNYWIFFTFLRNVFVCVEKKKKTNKWSLSRLQNKINLLIKSFTNSLVCMNEVRSTPKFY